jgi:hypothetical protein
MITVPIFEPVWSCRVNGIEHRGTGLLAKHLWGCAIESFTVFMGQFRVCVTPQTGEVSVDGRVVIKTDPARLKWFRRMEFNTYSGVNNTRSTIRCAFYGVGIEGENGPSGLRLHEDGTIVFGL